jgi:hypothetical protein
MRTQLSTSARIAACLSVLFALGQASAQVAAPQLDDFGRRAVVDAAAKALRDRHVYPGVGERGGPKT